MLESVDRIWTPYLEYNRWTAEHHLNGLYLLAQSLVEDGLYYWCKNLDGGQT